MTASIKRIFIQLEELALWIRGFFMEPQSLCILVQQRVRYSSCVFIYFTCAHPKIHCAAGLCLVPGFCILNRMLHREAFWANAYGF